MQLHLAVGRFTDESPENGIPLHLNFERELDWPVIPRVGEEMTFCGCCDPLMVDKVIHDATDSTITVVFDLEELATRAAVAIDCDLLIHHGWNLVK